MSLHEYARRHRMSIKDMVDQLRMETGQRTGCPICGSLGGWWDDEVGCCSDCDLDLTTGRWPEQSKNWEPPGNDTRHPNHRYP